LTLERRAEEVLTQEDLAPRRWSARLAPEDLPDIAGFDIGRVYQPGTGMMAGDFYDLIRLGSGRVAAVIGDVAGHGIDSSITAFQAKHLLRVFLKQYRDPAQALEELNAQLSTLERGEEFISCSVMVFDTNAETLRYASAGHPPAWLWHDREVRPLRSTGPLLMLDPSATYYSREIPMEPGDVVLLYTDGLAEARDGDQLFGEERIANMLRRDPGVEPGVLCKSLLEAAKDFASSALTDDVAILSVRRT
jgi:serine phosphatase RsbU (regulator of sigma subunit)